MVQFLYPKHSYTSILNSYLAIIGCQLLFVDTKVESNQKHKETMTNITKHHSEKERERDDSEKTRIDFAITSNTIGINDTLETCSEFVGAMIGGAGLFGM